MAQTYQLALAAAEAVIANVPHNGLANGTPYANSAMPQTSHIRAHLKWPINADDTPRGLEDSICRYTGAHLDTAARTALVPKAEFEVGVIIACARRCAWEYHAWSVAHLNRSEVATIPTADAALTVHANHEANVMAALTTWAAPGARYMGLAYYNAVSYETSNHNHLPAKTKRLATTTMNVSGAKDYIAGDAEREGSIFHDTFHPLSDATKSNLARSIPAKELLSALKFDNIRKRIPVKAPDCGVAINFVVLYRKSCAYHHNPEHLPVTLAPPATLATAIQAYETAVNAAALHRAVTHLRMLSEALVEPSAYLAGFVLGREKNATGDEDLDLATAARTTTILGSPAYKRAAGEYSGTFARGVAMGRANVASTVTSQVLPRCIRAVTAAGAIPVPP